MGDVLAGSNDAKDGRGGRGCCMFEGGGGSGESEGDPTVGRSIPGSSVRVEGKEDETGSS